MRDAAAAPAGTLSGRAICAGGAICRRRCCRNSRYTLGLRRPACASSCSARKGSPILTRSTPTGNITMPLIGRVSRAGPDDHQLAGASIAAKLKQGLHPRADVAVEVETYRPFFILGEVRIPGQYPYVANMTVETAVAIAGGFTPRAKKQRWSISTRPYGPQLCGRRAGLHAGAARRHGLCRRAVVLINRDHGRGSDPVAIVAFELKRGFRPSLSPHALLAAGRACAPAPACGSPRGSCRARRSESRGPPDRRNTSTSGRFCLTISTSVIGMRCIGLAEMQHGRHLRLLVGDSWRSCRRSSRPRRRGR